MSYLQSERKEALLEMLNGIGAAETASVTVKWPGGLKQSFAALQCDKSYQLKEGSSLPSPIPIASGTR